MPKSRYENVDKSWRKWLQSISLRRWIITKTIILFPTWLLPLFNPIRIRQIPHPESISSIHHITIRRIILTAIRSRTWLLLVYIGKGIKAISIEKAHIDLDEGEQTHERKSLRNCLPRAWGVETLSEGQKTFITSLWKWFCRWSLVLN